ncbi:nuclear transport factor 2 family protein [Thioalkalivibrio denitrificans]|uniref:nuclear transport factor 2 family protein n=1 Tax=Thioalkalivibrio denitrificans TaxID=108003 RepID=UPI001115980C|nr:nuclear transport factor 2 family protein [Thioalkalivibrio denitrificans]
MRFYLYLSWIAREVVLPPRHEETAVPPRNANDSRSFTPHWVDASLAHCNHDFESSSPFTRQCAGEHSGKLTGIAAISAYWRTILSHVPNLHCQFVDVPASIRCFTTLYRGHRDLLAEVFDFNAGGLAVRVPALYVE